ncbi:MAG: hypothetical protein UW27_C0002G0061 [Parcubacteria group bacterium GW2011_GWA1_44_13]|uniref:Uncharacterized protein n=1 Tax=Candidatus Nomurabacteria bacterium GW2011_GWB1_44_12 TaxID=1618748 RepID=A0A837I8B2_9BACT|nr:MAG: hypothetical protein UW17_C0014G0004 [Candidatus Nomurabacteria bacterium GW2011_GWD1_44_10]KKT37117.1 MAG: hypothetical protein UW25_C0002G0063 [Candidatus Nomurabacteria bacterium GW2011_GWB1_44_12]KKT38411.1 MAG: hypothetical protein UW27_C0002G0061 [Parcubacteria group bacterium GW2011_GWA1_44_13]KKT60761.1 MAG: hypothetical protein UW54_C0004G0023 [Parcubacteria group bacterium GW2011_GWC1_44_26]
MLPIQCEVGMRGAVPQKGFKMKLSINQGPFVDRIDYGFIMSTEHCKQLSNFLWDWTDSLPKEISRHIAVIVVNPTGLINLSESVGLKVVLSGGFSNRRWETQFEGIFIYSGSDGVRVSADKLTMSVRSALEEEVKKYQPLLSQLGSMVETLAVRY